MIPRYQSRFRLTLALLLGLFLLINVLTIALLSLAPKGREALFPLLLTFVLVTAPVGLTGIVLVVRRLLRPDRRLVDEAERAPVAKRTSSERDETEFVLETFQDVVAQLQSQGKQLDRLRELASARAASAEKFNEHIVASVPSGLIAFDAAARARMVNDSARALLGASGATEGESARELLRDVPDLAAMVDYCLKTGEVRRREEFVISGTDGQPRRIGATVAPIELQAERGALCLLTDITEVVELREALALKRNLESLGEMSAGLAHELKNALATLHGYAQFLLTANGEEHRREAAGAMLGEVRSLTEMVTSFLNFARPQPLNLEETSLRELIAECGEELRPLFAGSEITLTITGEFPDLRADELMLRQALINIMRNAAEAIGAGRPEREVRVRGSRQVDARGKEWALVEITDTGEGVRPADRQRIFIPFFTTKSKGHGVGLALAHRVVTQHGGHIAATNAPTGGACFTIKLPLAPEAVP